jgi:hypothetical protein
MESTTVIPTVIATVIALVASDIQAEYRGVECPGIVAA